MAKFCQCCGQELSTGVKFCAGCGTNISTSVAELKAENQSQQNADRQEKAVKRQSDVEQTAKSTVKQAVQVPLSNLSEQFASSETGESVLGTFGNMTDTLTQASEILNPFKTILLSVKGVFGNIIGIFKNKQWKKLIIAGVLALVWIVLMILSRRGINIGILNWLTFARGGMGRGVIGWIGGLLGKTSVAAMVFTLVGGGFRSLGGGIKALFKSDNFKTQNLSVLMLGTGGALVIYQFFAGNAVPTDTMSALSCGLLSVMALGGNGGFISRLAQSLTAKVSGKVRMPQNEKANSLLSGLIYGFALGAAVSLIPFGWIPVILGAVCMIAGIIFNIVFRNKKGASA